MSEATFDYRTAHGLGNVFVILDARFEPLEMTPERARRIADGEGGLGCDQVLVLRPPAGEGAAAMETFNADGSPAAACGNGARCLAWLLLQERGGGLAPLVLEALMEGRAAGAPLLCRLARPPAEPLPDDPYAAGASGWVEVAFPAPRFHLPDLPLAGALLDHLGPRAGAEAEGGAGAGAAPAVLAPHELAPLLEGVEAGDLAGPAVFVSLGNPHLVLQAASPAALAEVELERIGPLLAKQPCFPEGMNIQWAAAGGGQAGGAGSQQGGPPFRLLHRVWERGAGLTLSSGSGAAAAAAAFIRQGLAPAQLSVIEPGGGVLEVAWEASEASLRQTGPVCFTGKGALSLADF